MAVCKPCLSTDLKKVLKGAVGDDELLKMIDEVPNCPKGMEMRLCPAGTKSRGAGQKAKRAPTAYQMHIKQCMVNKPIKGKPFGTASRYLKECAKEWRQQKKS